MSGMTWGIDELNGLDLVSSAFENGNIVVAWGLVLFRLKYYIYTTYPDQTEMYVTLVYDNIPTPLELISNYTDPFTA